MRATIATALMVCLSIGGARAQERPDLTPRAVRWQTYPSDVRRVVFDAEQRPWFQLRDQGERLTSAQLQGRVERAWRLTTPYVRGAWLLGVDGAARLWMLSADRKTALAYHPESGWLVRPAGRAGLQPREPAREGRFDRTLFVARDGRVFLGDRRGVHLLDAAGRWSYQALYRRNFAETRFYGDIRSFNRLELCEDAGGRVMLWSGWGTYGWTGTLGLFVHDARGWRHWRPTAGGKAERLRSVVPQADGWTLICPDKGPAYRVQLHSPPIDHRPAVARIVPSLADPSYRAREAASRRLLALGPDALPALRAAVPGAVELEVRRRLERAIEGLVARQGPPLVDGRVVRYVRALCTDREGQTWLWADSVAAPGQTAERGALWRIAPEGWLLRAPRAAQGWFPDSTFVDRKGRVYFARYEKGVVMFDDEQATALTDATQLAYRYVLGEDAAGRIYLSDERHVAAVDLRREDARAALPTTIHAVPRGESVVVADSRGQTWALLEGRPFLSRWDRGRWVHVAPPGGRKIRDLTYLQPLKRGGLLAQQSPRRRAYYYDGTRWQHHANLRTLVDAHHAALAARVDNRRRGRDHYAKLRVDAAGRLWLARWKHFEVRDAIGWLSVDAGLGVVEHLLPLPGGGMLASGRGARLALAVEGRRVVRRALPRPLGRMSSDYTTRSGHWLDADGALRLPLDRGRHLHLGGAPLRAREVAGGFPRLQDRAGNVWCLDPHGKRLTVVPPGGGASATLVEDGLHESSAVTQDASGRIWVGTTRGLLALTVARAAGRVTVTRGTHYERSVPRGKCLLMHVDAENNLWFYGPGPDAYRLYRVELPD